ARITRDGHLQCCGAIVTRIRVFRAAPGGGSESRPGRGDMAPAHGRRARISALLRPRRRARGTTRPHRNRPRTPPDGPLATPGLPAPPKPWSEPVRRHFEEVAAWSLEEGGYSHMHATRPSTVAAGLLDSPVALAAWIGEKWMRWSATSADGLPSLSRE